MAAVWAPATFGLWAHDGAKGSGFGQHELSPWGSWLPSPSRPADALRAATLDTAEFLGLQNSLGTAETGKFADLVLLDANPLEDIRNTQKISGVFMQGHYFDRLALDGLLQKVETQAAATR